MTRGTLQIHSWREWGAGWLWWWVMGGGGCGCGNILSGIIALWLNEEHLFNTCRPATINQRKDDYLNRGRWVLKSLRLPEAEVCCLIQGQREILDLLGYQIPWKPEWSNEMSGWPCPGFSHARICFEVYFLLGKLSVETSPGLQRTISLMVKGQGASTLYVWTDKTEKLLRLLFSNCLSARSGRLLWACPEIPLFSYLQTSTMCTYTIDI